ncbi:MAG TPA: amino acid permease [Bacteroidia bacterium]|nr:amino acid permease [Bacteroidia bacterium]
MAIQSKLGRFDLTMIIISFVIGVGIFRTPSIVAKDAVTPSIFYIAWIIGGIVSIFGALTFAEIGSRMPVAGGYYKVFSQCYHPAFAFMLNWALVITNAGSAVGVALLGAEYIQPVLIPADWQHIFTTKLIAGTVLTVLFTLNYLGIRMGSRVQNVLSALKVLMLLGLCCAVFGNDHPTSETVTTTLSASGTIGALGLALISISFTLGGYQNTINLGADIQNPNRNIPIGIFSGMAIIIVLYLLINFAYCSVLGFNNLKNMQLPAAELAKSFLGENGYKATSIIVFVSVLGFINTSFMHNPRIYYAMAEDKVLPPIFKKVNDSTQTQEFGLSFFFALNIISLLFLDSFNKIINYVEFIDTLSLAFAAASIFILRRRKSQLDYKGYRVLLYPVIPTLFIMLQLWVCYNVFHSHITEAEYGMVIVTGGFPLYYLIKRLL